MNSINLVSPQGFTTAVLIADKTNNDNIATMTQVNGEVVSAALEIQSVLGALLIPRMTTAQRTASGFVPTDGMIVYDTDFKDFFYYRNNAWNISSGSGTVTSITAGANLLATPSNPITTSGTIALASALTGITSVASGGSLLLETNGSTLAVTIDASQNAKFEQNIYLHANSATRGLYSFAGAAGTGGVFFDSATGALRFNGGTNTTLWSFYDTNGLPVFQVVNNGATGWTAIDNEIIYTQGTMTLSTNGGTSLATALTLDTSQNATFAGTVGVNGSINFNTNSTSLGLYSQQAETSAGGVYMDAAVGNFRFVGGTASNAWEIFDSTAKLLFYVFNSGSTTNSIGINNGVLVLQSTGGALQMTSPTSMPGGNYTITWPAAVATITGQALTSSTGGALSWTNVALSGGNTLGANMTLGTTDAHSLILETSGTPALTLSSSQVATFAGVVNFAGGTSATATAGAASLPAAPVGFINVEVGGTNFRVPYYNT